MSRTAATALRRVSSGGFREPAGEFKVALAVADFDGEVAGFSVGDDADGAGIRGGAGIVERDGDGDAVVVLEDVGFGVALGPDFENVGLGPGHGIAAPLWSGLSRR